MRWSNSRPVSDLRTPPHCLKKKATFPFGLRRLDAASSDATGRVIPKRGRVRALQMEFHVASVHSIFDLSLIGTSFSRTIGQILSKPEFFREYVVNANQSKHEHGTPIIWAGWPSIGHQSGSASWPICVKYILPNFSIGWLNTPAARFCPELLDTRLHLVFGAASGLHRLARIESVKIREIRVKVLAP